MVVFRWIVAFREQFGDLLDGVAKNEDVVIADFFMDLDVGSIKGADGDGAVEGELHVAGARGFFACCGDLLREVGCGNDALRKRNAVVWQEGNFDQVFDAWVGVDLGSHGIDGFDDELGGIVSWCGFGSEDEDAWGERLFGILENAAVEGQNVEQIQVLTLVFVEALDLDVEEGRGIDLNAALFLNDLGEEFLVLVFDRHEFLAELGIFGEGFEFAELVEIAFPSASDAGRDEVG